MADTLLLYTILANKFNITFIITDKDRRGGCFSKVKSIVFRKYSRIARKLGNS